MRSALSAGAIPALVLFVTSLPALAGDEVNYSAPYLTVENGELVTKYPAREHDSGSGETDAPADVSAKIPGPETRPKRLWVFVAALIGATVALLLLVKQRRRKAFRVE
ncbi:hypothetical protein GWP57_13570 [Gammaproteobacteria bacterium]|jgi:hypothetical protein|nr:hypothetical protein [Gammaproteobacteria bacterium]